MSQFKSDFSLFPIKKIGKTGWEYRKASWPQNIDPEVHKLFDKETIDPIYYSRQRDFDKKTQYCKICKIGEEIIIHPGDGYDFLIRRDSFLNKNKEEIIDNVSVPHDMLCIVCLCNKRTHVIVECGHVSLCGLCSKIIYENDKKCPICRGKINEVPKKLFFS